MKIETERLYIRYFGESDSSDLFDYLVKEDVVRYEPYAPFSYDEAIQEAKRRAEDKNFYAVALKIGKVIGNLYLAKRDFDTWELGYVFNSDFWGKGYAFESARALITNAFENWGARRIVAMCNPLNEPSWKLLEHLTFRREGTLRRNIYFSTDDSGNPIWQDTYEYGLLKEEWNMAMDRNSLVEIIKDQTYRAFWEVKNVIDCVPDELWNKEYCNMPCWKHIYHMLHSLDRWFINPRDKAYIEPEIHEKDLNNLNVKSNKSLSREEINHYLTNTESKIKAYLSHLTDNQLLHTPPDCEYHKFTLILSQFRHLHSHMGMIMGFLIDDKGLWPRVLGLENPFPVGEYSKYM